MIFSHAIYALSSVQNTFNYRLFTSNYVIKNLVKHEDFRPVLIATKNRLETRLHIHCTQKSQFLHEQKIKLAKPHANAFV